MSSQGSVAPFADSQQNFYSKSKQKKERKNILKQLEKYEDVDDEVRLVPQLDKVQSAEDKQLPPNKSKTNLSLSNLPLATELFKQSRRSVNLTKMKEEKQIESAL